MIVDDNLFRKAEILQKEMHEFIEDLMSRNENLSYDAAQISFFLVKIAQLQSDVDQFPVVYRNDYLK